MAKTARQWSSLDKAAVKILARLKADDPRDLSYRQMARLTGMTPSRLSGLFLETMGPPTLDEFCTLCELLGQSAPDTLQTAIAESKTDVPNHATTAADTEGTKQALDTSGAGSVPDMSGWTTDEQADYIANHLDQFDYAAKRGDSEAEQLAYEEMP